jgi:hypothetical protein
MSKKCTKCEVNRLLTEYSFRNKIEQKLHNICKICLNNYAKGYRSENKEMVKAKHQKWVQENIEYRKEYINNNKEHINELSRKKYATDINFRLKKIMRTRFAKTVMKEKKYSKILNYLGVSLDYFKQWIEYQFNDKMSWDNQGTYWDFDHVMPCNSYDFSKEENIKLCFNWTNIRPLEKRENYIKNNKVDYDIINSHNDIKKQYILLHPVLI